MWAPQSCDFPEKEDNEFCPCPPHPWRSFVLSGKPTWEGHRTAKEASLKLQTDPSYVLKFRGEDADRQIREDEVRKDAILAVYCTARQQWVQAGHQLPNQKEILKLKLERGPKHAEAPRSLV